MRGRDFFCVVTVLPASLDPFNDEPEGVSAGQKTPNRKKLGSNLAHSTTRGLAVSLKAESVAGVTRLRDAAQ